MCSTSPLFSTAATSLSNSYPNTGAFATQYKIGDIPDGSSNTLVLAERLAQCGATTIYYTQRDQGYFTTGIPNPLNNYPVPAFDWVTANGGIYDNGSGGTYPKPPAIPYLMPPVPQIGKSRNTCNTGPVKYTIPLPSSGDTAGYIYDIAWEPSTGHTGAMPVAVADGSVRLVSGSISQTTWYYACNPADHQPLPSDW